MDRRRFEHLYVELSTALGERVPRYDLWLSLREQGLDPEDLELEEVLDYEERHLGGFMAGHGYVLRPRQRRRLRRVLARYDPELETPYAWMARLTEREP